MNICPLEGWGRLELAGRRPGGRPETRFFFSDAVEEDVWCESRTCRSREVWSKTHWTGDPSRCSFLCVRLQLMGEAGLSARMKTVDKTCDMIT